MAPAPCQNHLDLPAVGVCMRCKAPFCAVCITKLDGVNHCQGCLVTLAQAAPAAAKRSWPLPPFFSLTLAGLSLWLLWWITLTALFPGGPSP